MCSQVRCQTCSKPTWTGCGRHIEQALANVPKPQRCTCREVAQKKDTQPAPKAKGFWGLFG
ncbi:MAG: hypothetical protein Q8L48_05015 [Archangium sp.]|nr:hypothetical protein [Archangium sp.]